MDVVWIEPPEPREEVMQHSSAAETTGHPQPNNAPPPVKAGGEPTKFDRNAYQREYMRSRRAKAKESK
jgi:hypothetical protein